MHSFSDSGLGWSKELQWENDCGFFTMFSTSEQTSIVAHVDNHFTNILLANYRIRAKRSTYMRVKKGNGGAESMQHVKMT